MPAPGAPIGAALLPGNIHRKRSSYGGPTLLLTCLPIMVACLSGRPKLLHNIPLVFIADLFRLFPYLTLGLCLGLSFGVWASAPNPHLHWQRSISGWGHSVVVSTSSMQVILNSLLLSPLRPWSSSSIQVDLPTGEEPSQGVGIFLPSLFPPGRTGPILILFFLFSSLIMWRFLVFLKV